MNRRCMGTVMLFLLAAATPLAAQGAEGYGTDFETGATGWAFQQLNDQVRWTIDSSPVVFVSPTQTLNNVDSVVGIQAEGVADAYAPSGFFNGPGDRIIKHWCRFQFLEQDYETAYRWMRLGPQLLTGDILATFFYDDPDIGNGAGLLCNGFNDAPSNLLANSFLAQCPASDWHEHTFFVGLNSGEIVHNGVSLAGSAIAANALDDSPILQVGFFFEWTGKDDCPNVGGPTPKYGVVAWLLDDLFLSSSEFDIFDPQPEITGAADAASGGGGKGGFDCIGGVVTAGGNSGGGGPTGMMSAIIGLLILGAGLLQLKRRLMGVMA